MLYRIEFDKLKYLQTNSDGIDSDRYIISFRVIKVNQPPQSDEISKHQIKVSIAGTILATERLWNFSESDALKVVYAHTCKLIKNLIIEDNVEEYIELDLDEGLLLKYKVDPEKVPEVDNFSCVLEVDEPKKEFGFRSS